METVSIVLATYNGAIYIEKQLESYFSQTVLANEIVIYDDGSTDDTVSIIEKYKDKYPEVIKFSVNNSNIGTKKTIEKAILDAQGDIIFLSDQDDIWLPDKIEKIVRKFNDDPECWGVFSNTKFIDINGKELEGTFWDRVGFFKSDRETSIDLCEYILRYGNIACGTSLAIRKISLNYITPFRLMDTIWHDEWICLVLASMNRLTFIDDTLLLYRLHNSQQVGISSEWEKNHKILLGKLKNKTLSTEDPSKYFSYTWGIYKKVMLYHDFIPKLLPYLKTFHKEATFGKLNFITQERFFKKKLRLIKWALSKKFETTFNEVFAL